MEIISKKENIIIGRLKEDAVDLFYHFTGFSEIFCTNDRVDLFSKGWRSSLSKMLDPPPIVASRTEMSRKVTGKN